MSDKQVIMSKSEFDNMEKELNNLRKIVESKTVCRIGIPRLTWSNIHGGSNIDSYDVQYVIGCDENEIVNELGAEIEKLKKEKGEINHIVNGLETKIRWYQHQEDEWKNLPWYKRLFV